MELTLVPARAVPRRPLEGLAFAAALAVLFASSGCIDIVGAEKGRYVERDEKRFTVSGTPDVTVTTFDGAIEVRPWDKSEVEVIVEKRGSSKAATDTIEVRADHDGNRVSVEARLAGSHGINLHFNDSRSARLIVSVPASSNLSARSGDGAIDVDRIAGRIQLHSGDGGIRARDVSGDLDLHTGDGSITVGGKLTGVRARSGDGSVTIQAVEGSAPSADWDIATGDGSVTLSIPEDFGAELDAHTGDGGISTQNITLSNVTGRVGRNSLKGRLGEGGRTLRIRTGDGSITLKRS
jgi:DUF4097 and DUF4098 domain-containing protein YvlB